MELKHIISERLSAYPGRLAHILGVNDEAIALAKRYGVDEDRVSMAALLHDVAKKMTMEELRKYMVLGGFDQSVHPKTWHAYVGVYIAKTEFDIVDDDILDAIRYHTTGHPRMNPVAEILFVADFIERRTRDFPGVQRLRELAYQDLNACICYKLNHLVTQIAQPHPDSIAAYAHYKEYCQIVT
jgi:predicted HD superfamily hydrolase involved in NAD metabolism